MFATIRRYSVSGDTKTEMFRIIEKDYLDKVTEISGFDGYFVVDNGETEVAAIALFETREGADESTRLAADTVRNHADTLRLEPPRVTAGNVVFHRESSRLLAAH